MVKQIPTILEAATRELWAGMLTIRLQRQTLTKYLPHRI